MSKKINIMIAFIMCIVLMIPKVAYAEDCKLGVAMRSRADMYDLPMQCINSVFVGNENNAELFLKSLNELNNTVSLDGKTYLVLCDTNGTQQMKLIAFVFDDVYDIACLFVGLSYEQIIFDEPDLPFYQTHQVTPEHYDDDISKNGYDRTYILYSENCNVNVYKASVNLGTNTYTVWNEWADYEFEFERTDGYYWESYAYDTSIGDNYYTFLAGNTRLFLSTDVFINHSDKMCDDCTWAYEKYEYNSSLKMHCFHELWQGLTDFNKGAIYTNDGLENDNSGGGTDSSEHHIYLNDFNVNIVTKQRLISKYNLKDFIQSNTNTELYIMLSYALDNYQKQNLYDYKIQVDISDINGVVKTRYVPLSTDCLTYIPMYSILNDSECSWYNHLYVYEVSRTTNSYKSNNIVEFSYAYDTYNPSWDSSGNPIYPNWQEYKDIVNVSCKLVYEDDASKSYNKSFRLYGGSVENDDGIGENDNPYVPEDDNYDGNDIVPTPDYTTESDGVNIIINNTNNNDVSDDDDDVDLTIYDDDYTDSALREDLKDGFGLIDNVDTPEKADGFLGLVADFYTNTLDKNFKDIIMFGISSVVAISIIRAVFRR